MSIGSYKVVCLHQKGTIVEPMAVYVCMFYLLLTSFAFLYQIKHAICAYRNALSVFKGTTWSHIRDHVHFQIGKWYAFLVRLKHMLEIVACSHQSKPIQELFMKDFFSI